MMTRGARILGASGFVSGAAAAALESSSLLDLGDQDRTALFFAIAAFSVTTLLTAILLTCLRAARHMEERTTQVQPVVDALLIGISMGRITQSGPQGRRGRVDPAGSTDTRAVQDQEKASKEESPRQPPPERRNLAR